MKQRKKRTSKSQVFETILYDRSELGVLSPGKKNWIIMLLH